MLASLHVGLVALEAFEPRVVVLEELVSLNREARPVALRGLRDDAAGWASTQACQTSGAPMDSGATTRF